MPLTFLYWSCTLRPCLNLLWLFKFKSTKIPPSQNSDAQLPLVTFQVHREPPVLMATVLDTYREHFWPCRVLWEGAALWSHPPPIQGMRNMAPKLTPITSNFIYLKISIIPSDWHFGCWSSTPLPASWWEFIASFLFLHLSHFLPWKIPGQRKHIWGLLSCFLAVK